MDSDLSSESVVETSDEESIASESELDEDSALSENSTEDESEEGRECSQRTSLIFPPVLVTFPLFDQMQACLLQLTSCLSLEFLPVYLPVWLNE